MKKIVAFLLPLILLASSAFAQIVKPQSIEYDDFILHNGRTATNVGSFVSVDRSNTVGFDVSIAGTAATVDFRVSGAGRFGWQSLQCFPSDSDTPTTSATASGFYTCNVAAADVVSANLSVCTSCTVTVIVRRSTAVVGGAGGGGGLSSESDTLETVTGRGRTATTMTSSGTAMQIGDGVTPMCHFTSATLGPVIKPCTDANTRTYIWTNFVHQWFDVEGNSVMFTIDPDAASPFAMYQFASGYRPLKSIWFPAGSLSTDGTQCAAPAEATPVASGLKLFTVICADNDGSRMHLNVKMPDDWDAGTVTLQAVVTQTAADTNNIEYQSAGQCKGDTESLVAIASYGTEVVWTDAMSGSGKVNFATSGAITPSGTCGAGDFLGMYVDIGAGNTTTAMATVHILGFLLKYTSVSLSH